MKKNLSTRFLFNSVLIFFFLFSLNLTAQVEKQGFWDGWSAQANGGLSVFYGDIENYTFYKVPTNNNEYRMGYGLIVQKQFSPVFTLRGQLYQGFLSGCKREYSYWFEGDVIETSLSGKFDLFNLILANKDRKVSLYFMAGIGWANWQTELKSMKTNEVIADNGKNKTGSGLFGRTIEPVIPLGGGFDFRINKRWTANIEGSLRPVNSDKLDAKVGMKKIDFYSYNFVGITYHFGVGEEKPLPVEPAPELAVQEEKEPEIEIVPEPKEIKEEIAVKPPKPAVDPDRTLEENIISAESRTGLYETPWPGVEFTVQIAASKTMTDPEFFQKKYELSGEVEVNRADGWNRYSIGHYIKYWQAREYRNILATRNSINDAFVVAYKDGKRLMLTDLINSAYAQSGAENVKEDERPASKISFGVQVLATRDGNISTRAIREMYEIDMPVYKEFVDGWYQYAAGSFSSYSEAAKVRNKLKARGISGAFVIGYKDGERVKDLQSIMQ